MTDELGIVTARKFGRHWYGYDQDGHLMAIDAPIKSRAWCVEHEAPPARQSPGQCIELVKRLEAGSLADEPGDCQIVPNRPIPERLKR